MAEPREINPLLRQALELGPPIAFFVIYLRLKEDTFTIAGADYSGFIVATLAFVPIMLVAMGILWMLTGKLSRLQIFTAFMVIFFGGLTAYFNDERFFKLKTPIVYAFFSLLLGIGLLRGQSWLALVLNEMMPMRQEGWMILTRRLFWTFLGLAAANEIVWRTMSTDAWVKIETFGFPVVLMAILFWQITALQAYLIEPDDKAKE